MEVLSEDVELFAWKKRFRHPAPFQKCYVQAPPV
jgi:hypothetical protein